MNVNDGTDEPLDEIRTHAIRLDVARRFDLDEGDLVLLNGDEQTMYRQAQGILDFRAEAHRAELANGNYVPREGMPVRMPSARGDEDMRDFADALFNNPHGWEQR